MIVHQFKYNKSYINIEYDEIDSSALEQDIFVIKDIIVDDADSIDDLSLAFKKWLESNSIQFCSAKISSHEIKIANALIKQGFYYIETSIHPYLPKIPDNLSDEGLTLHVEQYIDRIKTLAFHAFKTERYHIDPHFSNASASKRYAFFVENSFRNPLHKIAILTGQSNDLIGFTTWTTTNNNAILFLIGIDQKFQGQGFAKKIWSGTLYLMHKQGVQSVKTTVSINNVASINLHCRLGFKLVDPEIVLHYTNLKVRR